MSTVERTLQWLERAGDWANPILVKETRQALKSRQFVITFMLLLGAAWIVSAFWLLSSGPELEYAATGRHLFVAFYAVLAFATVLIVPFSAFRSLQSEREFNTYELLNVTTLTPRQIVWGKLLSALVQLFIFYSAITPFIAFASLLQGFDAPRAAFILLASMLVSLFLSMEVLMFSTLAKQRVGQGFNSVVVLGQLSFALFGAFGFVLQAIEFDTLRIDSGEFWMNAAAVVIFGASYFILFQQITTAQLTFESDNRSTAIRLTGMVQFWMLWGAFVGWTWYYGSPWGPRGSYALLSGVTIASALHWTVFGLFMATEGDYLSRRVRRNLPRNVLVRALAVPFLPGGARGYLNLVLQVIALWLIVVCLSGWFAVRFGTVVSASEYVSGLFAFEPQSWNEVVRLVSALCCYILAYHGVGCALSRWGMMISSEIRPAHMRVVVILVALAGMVGPLIPKAVELVEWSRYSLIEAPNPISTLNELSRDFGRHGAVLALLAAGACLGIALNVRAMFRGALDILRAQPKAASAVVPLTSDS